MKELMQKLLKARVRPYYIYMADQVAGGEHFPDERREGPRDREGAPRLDVRVGGAALRDRRAGRRRQGPLLPEYVEEINEDEVIFRNYAGERYVYKQPRHPAIAVSGCDDAAAAQSTSFPFRWGRSRSREKKTVQGREKTGT
jgi:lysine 2,3-aminomutase